MQIGRYRVSLHNHGPFRLDGGAMFGSVPKPLWATWTEPDERNRIRMATRSLIVEDESGRRLLVDVGCGDKWPEKQRDIFAIPADPYVPVPGVTDVLLTHLHFDHAGGVSSRDSTGRLVPNYPDARHYVSRANLENAKNPNIRERASYLAENVDVLTEVDLCLTDDANEVWPGVFVHQASGHTLGLQWVGVTDAGLTIAFPSDLCPTSHHLPQHFTMGYDMCAERGVNEKREFLERAVAGRWLVVFQHDPDVAAATVSFDDKGRPVKHPVADI